MIERDTPTEEGKRRWPPAGRYCANESPGPACTCNPACDEPCKGQCGCEACNEAYQDFLSMPDRTCKTCRHWGQKPPQGTLFYFDKHIPAANVCGIAWFIRHEDDIKPNDIAVMDENSRWSIALTGPDFGCVRHEPRE